MAASQYNSDKNLDVEDETDDIPLLFNADNILYTEVNDTLNTVDHEVLGGRDYRQEDHSRSENDRGPVPVTILSGFLGSGKTTLLRCILQSKTLRRRVAIIENEISGIKVDDDTRASGALNIESLILRDGVKQENIFDLVELPNGCICCTVKDSLVTTLEMLLKKKNDIDYIIIECSGMANPGPIASVFWLDDALQSQLKLDGIITIVDARNFEMQLKETSSFKNGVDHSTLREATEGEQRGDEAAQQVAYADRIIINKTDLLAYDDEDMLNQKIDSIKKIIRTINRAAPIRITTFSQIFDIEWLLDLGSFSFDRFCHNTAISQCSCNFSLCGLCSEAISPVNALIRFPLHGHTSNIKTVVIIQEGSAHLSKVKSWLATILWPDQDYKESIIPRRDSKLGESANVIEQRSMKIFRIKGLLSIKLKFPEGSYNRSLIDDEDLVFVDEDGLDKRRYIVQAVNDVWDVQPSQDMHWESGSSRLSKVVIIGRLLDEDLLRSTFLSCLS